MNFSKETIDILKNFSSINANFYSKGGNVITTVSETKTCLASAIISEDLPEFGIWDLPRFLSTVSLLEQPSFTFNDKIIVISCDKTGRSVEYAPSDANTLTYPKKMIPKQDSVVDIELSHAEIAELTKAAAVMDLPNLLITKKSGSNDIIASLAKFSKIQDRYDIKVGEEESDSEFTFVFKIENFNMLPIDYSVSIAERAVAHFYNDTRKVSYWLALEQDSTYVAETEKAVASK